MNSIANPFRQGQQISIPAGTVVHSMNPRHTGPRVLARAQVVTIHHASNGWVDLWNDYKRGRGLTVLPTITWPGGGGYWQTVQVTAELLDANGASPLVMADLDRYDRTLLDVEPSFDEGYTNQWEAPAEARTLASV